MLTLSDKYRRLNHLGICNCRKQLPRSTQPGHPFVGGRDEYQQKSGVAVNDVLTLYGPWLGKDFFSVTATSVNIVCVSR